MRDLLFKNLTSLDKKRKMLSSSEIQDREGVHSIVRRHFVCLAREVKAAHEAIPTPYLYVLKEVNHKEMKEKFLCRLKGSVFVSSQGKLFMVTFLHSLKICLISNSHPAI